MCEICKILSKLRKGRFLYFLPCEQMGQPTGHAGQYPQIHNPPPPPPIYSLPPLPIYNPPPPSYGNIHQEQVINMNHG